MKLPKGIIKLDNGLYEARFQYHGIRRTFYDRDLKQLIDKFEEAKYRIKSNSYEEDTKLTFKEFSAVYIDKKEFEETKAATVRSYQQALELHILPELGKYRMADITQEQIRNYLDSLSNYADSTKGIVMTVLRGMFALAVEENYLKRNVMDTIKLPKKQKANRATRNATKKAFTEEQYRIALNEAEKLTTSDLIKFTALTGLRSGEVRAIKHTDIDFKQSVLTVQRSIDQLGNIDTPKTDSGTRIVPLSAEAIEIVRKQKLISIKGFVFCDIHGEPFTANYMASEIRKLNSLCKKVDKEFPQFSLHTFRHTFATKCANNGMIPKVLMGIMGHKSIAMTMDYYAHQEVETAITEMKKVEGAF